MLSIEQRINVLLIKYDQEVKNKHDKNIIVISNQINELLNELENNEIQLRTEYVH